MVNIKTSVQNSANSKVEAEIKIELINKKIDKLAKQTAKSIKVDGFRKGKVPVAVVKSRHIEQLTKDAESEAIREVINSAMKELKIDVNSLVGEPAFVKFDKNDEVLTFTAEFNIKPDIDLGDYKTNIPDFEAEEVTEEEINSRLENIAKSQAPLKKIKDDRGLENGDIATIDFEGFVDGKAFDGGKAEAFELTIGSGQFIAGFEEQLIGMKIDEEKTINVTFPEEYQNKELAGKPSEFKVKLNKIQAKEIAAIDDAFAKTLLIEDENPTLETLKTKIKEQILSEKMAKIYTDELKPKFLENLINSLSIDVPNSIVEEEINYAINSKAQSMNETEIKELQENQEKIKELREEARPEAIKSVKATFIIDALAKATKVDVSDDEVMQTIYYEAMQNRQDPQEALKYYKENNILPAIKMSMVESKVLTKLFDEKLKG